MLPLPVLDDKSFQELLEDALKLIPQFTPEWTDYNLHDPGITMIELLAWLTEMQQFYQDQVGEQNYLKFLQLLGIKPEGAIQAKVDVTFSLPTTLPITVPKGTKLQAGEVFFETLETIRVNRAKLEKILTYSEGNATDNTDANRQTGIYYYAFGETVAQGSGLYLSFDNALEEPTLTFKLYEAYPERGSHEKERAEILQSAQLCWEYCFRNKDLTDIIVQQGVWQPLDIVKDETLGLSRSGRIYLSVPQSVPGEGQRQLIRCTVKQAGYEIPPKIENILLNTVQAVQQETLVRRNPLEGWENLKELGRQHSMSSNGLPRQTFTLPRTPVVSQTFALQVAEETQEGETEGISWRDWQLVEDFDASKPEDRHYALDPKTGKVVFGDGVNGRIPPAADQSGQENIRVVAYQVGGGKEGNVKAGAVNQLVCPPDSNLASLKVENRLPAVGGAEAESLEQAKARARSELNAVSRAVTFDDFEKLACLTPGLRVARAKAFATEQGVVKVVVIPYSQAPNTSPSQGFMETVLCHLDRHRLVTTRVEVLPPRYTAVNVTAAVGIKPSYDPNDTRDQIIAQLEKFLHPVWGGTEGTGWPFGRKVYKSELYQLLENVPGVDYIKQLTISGPEEVVLRSSETKPQSLVYLGESKIDIILPNGSKGGLC